MKRTALLVLIALVLSMSNGSAQRRRSFTDTAKGPYYLMPMPATGNLVDTCLLVRERTEKDTAKGEFVILRMLTDCSSLDGPR